jgi:hypothetical protein
MNSLFLYPSNLHFPERIREEQLNIRYGLDVTASRCHRCYEVGRNAGSRPRHRMTRFGTSGSLACFSFRCGNRILGHLPI